MPDPTFDRYAKPDVPYNLLAEESVLASCMVDPQAFGLCQPLKPSDFFGHDHRRIYEAILRLRGRGRGINQITVAHELGAALNEIGLVFLSNIITELPTPVGCEWSAEIVRECAVRRATIDRLGKEVRDVYNGSLPATPETPRRGREP